MANPRHLEFLLKNDEIDVKGWNEWRKRNAQVIPEISGTNLSGKNFTLADKDGWMVESINLESTDLEKVCLENAYLEGANLKDAYLEGANLKNADLFNAQLMNSYFEGANLEGAKLFNANLEGANFLGANLKGVNLGNAYLENASLFGAKLKNTNLQGSYLKNVDLSNADLSFTDLRYCRGLKLNNTFTLNARFSPKSNDPWSILSRKYTSLRLLVTLIVVLAFIIYTITRLKPCLDEDCQTLLLLTELFNLHNGWPIFTLTIMVIVYAILKAFLTSMVSPLREQEKRSGYSPHLGKPIHRLLFAVPKFIFSYFLKLVWHSLKYEGFWITKKVRKKRRELQGEWLSFWERSFTESYLWMYHIHLLLNLLFWACIVLAIIISFDLLTYTQAWLSSISFTS